MDYSRNPSKFPLFYFDSISNFMKYLQVPWRRRAQLLTLLLQKHRLPPLFILILYSWLHCSQFAFGIWISCSSPSSLRRAVLKISSYNCLSVFYWTHLFVMWFFFLKILGFTFSLHFKFREGKTRPRLQMNSVHYFHKSETLQMQFPGLITVWLPATCFLIVWAH